MPRGRKSDNTEIKSQKAIMIGENYKIQALDSLNICLYELHPAGGNINPKTGLPSEKDAWVILGYYGNSKHCLHALVEKELIKTGYNDLQEMFDKIEKLHQWIDRLNVVDVRLNNAISTI
jgi:hypothetical protein